MTRVIHLFAGNAAQGIGRDAALDIAALISQKTRLVRADWLPRKSERQDHEALQITSEDDRLACMAEALWRDYGRSAEPLLLLPSLTQETLHTIWGPVLAKLAEMMPEQICFRLWSTRTDLPECLVAALTEWGIEAKVGGQIKPLPDSAFAVHLNAQPIRNESSVTEKLQVATTAASPSRYQARRLLFIIEKLADRSGGAERVLIETANALSQRGHIVEIVTHEFRGVRPFYPLVPGVVHTNLRPPRRGLRRILGRVRNAWEHYAPEWPLMNRISWASRNGGFWRRLEAYLQTTEPDVAIAFMPPATTALALARLRHPMRRVTSTHNAPIQDFCNPERWDPSRLDRRLRLELMAQMDRIAVLLPEYRDFYSDALRDRLLILPNAVPQISMQRLANTARGKVVMAVGRLAKVKRHDLLIDAWAQISSEFPDWKLQIFGEGPLKPELAEQISRLDLTQNVQLMGHQKDVAEWYLGASILAHPAEFEGFPLAVTEALASGLPVIGFEDCSGLNRLVQKGENGVLVSATGDRTAHFAAALAGVMRDGAACARMSAAGPPSMAAYAPDAVIDLWEDMLFADEVPRGGLAG